MTAVTNVNPGDRDPRNGRFGGSRKFFSRDRSDDLLQDRDDLADDLVQDHAPEHYETAGDGSFDEALEEYYDTHADADYARTEPASRGKHHRVEEVLEPEEVEYADYDDYDDYSDYNETGHAVTAAGTAGAGYANANYAGNYAEGVEPDYVDAEVDADYERDYEPYYEDEDDRAVAAGVPAAAATTSAAPAAGAAAGAGSSSTAAAAGGVPKRGLAMILIAVALLLALWGVYAMTRGGADDQAANDPANQSAQDPNNPNAQNPNDPNAQGQNEQSGQGQAQSQNPNDPNAAGQQGQNANDPNAAGQQGQGQNPNDPNAQNQGNGAAPAGANAPMTRENMTVNVYNNSAITGFADQVATQAKGKGMNVGEVGNIPGEVVTFGENTVLFDKNTPGAEDRARELADKVGGVAVPIDDRIPDEAKKPGSLTLVLAENREVTL